MFLFCQPPRTIGKSADKIKIVPCIWPNYIKVSKMIHLSGNLSTASLSCLIVPCLRCYMALWHSCWHMPCEPPQTQHPPTTTNPSRYSCLRNSVNIKNYFFGCDVTYPPKRNLFLCPDNHATLNKDTLHLYSWHLQVLWRGVNYTPGPLFNQACVKVTAKSCTIWENTVSN